MTQQKINLEEILLNKYKEYKKLWNLPSVDPKYKEMVLSAMKEACGQTLELASENAEIDWSTEHEVAESICGGAGYTIYQIDKQSILDVINLIE